MTLGGSQALRDRARLNHQTQLADTAQIWRPTATTPTPDFGTDDTFTQVDEVSATFWAISGREAFTLNALQVKADVIVILPALTDVTELDEIVYTEYETDKIHHFIISYVFDRSKQLQQRVAATEYKYENRT